MYLAYLDDSAIEHKKTKLQVLSAVIVNDKHFQEIEVIAGIHIVDLVPEENMENFKEFHASELFNGCRVFEGIDQSIRFRAMHSLLMQVRDKKLPIVYGAVDVPKLRGKLYGSASPIDIAFRICAEGIDGWLDANDPQQFAVLIADDFADGKIKAELRQSFRQLRNQVRPPDFSCGKLQHVHDGMYFGDSKDSIGIQMADLCSYFIAKHLEGDTTAEGFYNTIKDQIVYCKVEPE
ncbi:MAG: DUF3800 domain-containing protein [Terriglobia bacterium]|jgi:hypothetical protein